VAKRQTPRWLNLGDAADADRALQARLELLHLLGDDPRVQRAMRQWAATPRARQCLALIRVAATDPDAAAVWAKERPAATAIVMAPLHLACRWLGTWLADLACLMVIQEEAEWRSVRFTFEGAGIAGYDGPTHRRAKRDGATIARDVRWFYRAVLKSPRDSVKQLAREYGHAEQRFTDPRSVIQDGIARAKVLLDLR
jgi:hypothetical protein